MMRILVIIVLYFSYFTAFSQDKERSDDFFESIEKGAVIYEDFCMNCHLPDGKGVENLNPPLALSDYLMENRENSIKAVKFGLSGEISVNGKKYSGTMTSMGLSDKEISEVMNYITNSFGNRNDKMFTEEEVLKIEE